MTKVSTNAGKHPYMRTGAEYDHLFAPIGIDKPGLKLNHSITPKFTVEIETEYKDKKGKKIFFKDVIIYEKKEYVIDYNAKEFYWIAQCLTDPGKTFKLSKIASCTILHKKRNKT